MFKVENYQNVTTKMIGPRKRYSQHGRGIGSILSSVFRKILPFAKTILGIGRKAVNSKTGQSVIKSAKNEALKTGIQVADDALKGRNIGESIKRNAKSAGKNIANTALKEAESLLGNPPPSKIKKKISIKPRSKKKRRLKAKNKDIFAK